MDNYVDKKYYKSDITGEVIGCAQKVHQQLGNGFQEVIYQRALEIELRKIKMKFEREKEMDITYDNFLIGHRRIDFLVDKDIMAELKAVTALEDVHVAQLINYMEVYKIKAGLLINFGSKSLEVRRFVK